MDERALNIVRQYIEEHLDKSDKKPQFEVFIVWKAKVLQNWKYLISSTLYDGMYYELTYNGDRNEWYLDAYKKFENRVVSIAEQTEPSTEVETMSCAECKHRPIGAEICEEACHYESQTDWHYDEQDATWYPYKHEYEPKTEPSTDGYACLKKVGAKANQTEPNSSEKPNNCETCRHYTLACDLFSEICKYEPKDEPQMEDLQDWKDQMWAEAIVIEPITEDCSMISCLKCEHNEHCHYLVKDIPWSDCPWKRRYEYNRVCSIINGQ